MEEFFTIITDLIKAYFETPLPKDTAMAIYKAFNDVFLPLMYEYITVIFG